MPRKLRIGVITLCVVAGLVAAAFGGVYIALGRVRPFYEQALQLDSETLQTGSRHLESRATALFSEARQPGEWRATFTSDQINGWLALRLAEIYADSLPDEISEPRVAIGDDRFSLGFRARRGGMDTVISADVMVMLTEHGEIAIRLLSVQAGTIPMPVMQLADDLSKACQRMSLPVRWTQVNAQPIALVDVNLAANTKNTRVRLNTVKLRAGALYLAGQTESLETESAAASKSLELTVER